MPSVPKVFCCLLFYFTTDITLISRVIRNFNNELTRNSVCIFSIFRQLGVVGSTYRSICGCRGCTYGVKRWRMRSEIFFCSIIPYLKLSVSLSQNIEKERSLKLYTRRFTEFSCTLRKAYHSTVGVLLSPTISVYLWLHFKERRVQTTVKCISWKPTTPLPYHPLIQNEKIIHHIHRIYLWSVCSQTSNIDVTSIFSQFSETFEERYAVSSFFIQCRWRKCST